MKPTNLEGVGSHAEAIIRGWIDQGLTFRSGTTIGIDVRDLTIIGGTLTPNGDGTWTLTIGGTGGGPGTGGTPTGSAPVNMLNNSGQDLLPGDVVVTDATADTAVTITTDEGSTLIAGVVQEPIGDGEIGPVLFNGYAPTINAPDAVRGEYAKTSTTATEATSTADRESGSFAVYMTGASDMPDFATDAVTTTSDVRVTSLDIDLPASIPVDRELFLALWLESTTSSISIPNWTRIGSTSGFYYFYRASTGDDAAVASWTGLSVAVASVLLLNPSVSLAVPIEDHDYDATTAAASVSGLSDIARYAIAGVDADVATPGSGFARLAGGTADASSSIAGLTGSNAGGWSWFQDPRALAHGAYTYIGYNALGDLKVAVATGGAVVNTVTIAAALEYDDHDTPTLYYDPINDKLIVTYSEHGGAALYKRVSSSTLTSAPTLSGGFGGATDLATTFEVLADRSITYPSPVYTNNSDGSGLDELWVFYRDVVSGGDSQWHYNSSTDGGATWFGLSTHLHSLTYSKVVSDGVGKIHVASSDHPADGATKIYHMYRESGAWHKSDGTGMGVGIPFSGADMTTVYDSGGDLVWVWDEALDNTGKPYIVFVRFASTTDHRYMYARWTGSAWSVHEIASAGGTIATDLGFNADQVYYSGGVVLDQDDPQIVYASRYVSGAFEMFKYVTADGGASFSSEQLTFSGKHIRPVGVRNQDDIAMVWLSGDYASYVDYDQGIDAYLPGTPVSVAGTLAGKYIGHDAAVTSPFSGAGNEDDAIFAINLLRDAMPSALLYGPDLLGTADAGGSTASYAWQPLVNSGDGTVLLDSGTGNPIMAFAPV